MAGCEHVLQHLHVDGDCKWACIASCSCGWATWQQQAPAMPQLSGMASAAAAAQLPTPTRCVEGIWVLTAHTAAHCGTAG